MDIGFYIVNCDNSEKHNTIIELINMIITNHPYDNITLFNNKYQRIDKVKKFPILHLSHAKYFRGTLVYFDMKSATLAKSFPGPSKQIFCCESLDWAGNLSNRAILWQNIYHNMNIVTTSQKVADVLDICWTLNVKKISGFNEEEFYNVISTI